MKIFVPGFGPLYDTAGGPDSESNEGPRGLFACAAQLDAKRITGRARRKYQRLRSNALRADLTGGHLAPGLLSGSRAGNP